MLYNSCFIWCVRFSLALLRVSKLRESTYQVVSRTGSLKSMKKNIYFTWTVILKGRLTFKLMQSSSSSLAHYNISKPELHYPDRAKMTWDKDLKDSPRTAVLCLCSSGFHQPSCQVSNPVSHKNYNYHLPGLSSQSFLPSCYLLMGCSSSSPVFKKEKYIWRCLC